jgi:Ankyrin repeats (3 copies)
VEVTDRQFNTALHLISRDGLHDLIGLLVDPPRPTIYSKNGKNVTGLDVNLKGHGGVTALMLAAYKGHVNVVRELLKVGADPDIVDRHRATALMYAILTTQFIEPCPAIIKMLVRYNCDINKPANVKEMCKFWAISPAVFR